MILSGSKEAGVRLTNSTMWVEQYKDRMQQLLQDPAAEQSAKVGSPVRALLLQDCYDGQDALAIEIGRDVDNPNSYAHMVVLVGDNNLNSENKFQLELFGFDREVQDLVSIGQTGALKQFGSMSDFYDGLFTIPELNKENTAVLLGNPYYNDDLLEYGSVQQENDGKPKSSLLGLWYITIDNESFKEKYSHLVIKPLYGEESTILGPTSIAVEKTLDLLASETTLITDIYYRPRQYAWQAGTIATCLDFNDIGYGIIGASARNLNVQAPEF